LAVMPKGAVRQFEQRAPAKKKGKAEPGEPLRNLKKILRNSMGIAVLKGLKRRKDPFGSIETSEIEICSRGPKQKDSP